MINFGDHASAPPPAGLGPHAKRLPKADRRPRTRTQAGPPPCQDAGQCICRRQNLYEPTHQMMTGRR
ncbi:MAG: hypothetical protein ACYDHX_10540 [Methanothrix sp.]